MEGIKSWAVCAVVSALVCAVVELLSPQGGSERSIKFLTSVFVLLAFVSPFADIKLSAADYTGGINSFIEAHELEEAVEKQAKQALSSQIVSSLGAYLESLDFAFADIDVSVVIDSEKNISIQSITVNTSITDISKLEKAIAYSEENFGVIPQFEE